MAKAKTNKNRIVDTPAHQYSWDDDNDRLILYADIMGFSHRVNSSNHCDLKEDLIAFKQAWESRLKPLQASDHLRSVQFSDSILIVVNGTNSKMFNLISKAAICLMQCAIELGFPIKGVISQGKFTYDRAKELYFGTPLVNAYLLHEEIHYYGIVVHHSAEQTVKKYTDASNPYSKTEIPLKKGKVSHYHLSWHLLNKNLSKGDIGKDVNEWLDNIEEQVSGAPRIYVDHTRNVIMKDTSQWETTLDAD